MSFREAFKKKCGFFPHWGGGGQGQIHTFIKVTYNSLQQLIIKKHDMVVNKQDQKSLVDVEMR